MRAICDCGEIVERKNFGAATCNKCRIAKEKKRHASEHSLQLARARAKRNPNHNAACREYEKTPRARELQLIRKWKRLYNLDEAEAKAILAEGCALAAIGNCKGTPGIDHDHTTGKVRGCLCNLHNRSIGQLGDTAWSVSLAAAYLARAEA